MTTKLSWLAILLFANVAAAQVQMQMQAPVQIQTPIAIPRVQYLNPVLPYGPSFKPIIVAPTPQPMPVPYQPPAQPIFQRPAEPVRAPVIEPPAPVIVQQPRAPQPRVQEPSTQTPRTQEPPRQPPSLPTEQAPPRQPPSLPRPREPSSGLPPPPPPVSTPTPPPLPVCSDERERTSKCLQIRFDESMTKGRRLMQDNRFEEALAQFKRAVANSEYPFLRAEAYHAVGAALVALTEYAHALDAFDQDPYEGTFARGMTYWLVGDLENAERALRNAARKPTARSVYFEQLSTVLKERGRPEEVPAIFKDAYERDPNRDWALERWFAAMFENFSFDQIRNEFAGLTTSAQSDRRVKFYFGAANVRLNRPREGIPYLLAVILEHPADAGAYGELAAAYEKTGETALAQQYKAEYLRRLRELGIDRS